MKRDSLYNELVIWSGRPKEIATPSIYRATAAVSLVTSAIATTSAIVVSSLDVRPTQLLVFAAWMAILAVGAFYGPRWWRSELEFEITDVHIIMRRGRMRRTIETKSISYARIHWHPKSPGIGDLELVRAVPTGALRRRLAIVLPGLVAPDRVWSIIRGVTPAAGTGDGHRLLAQRLDENETVLWSGHPANGWRKWIPTGVRAMGSLAIAAMLSFVAIYTSMHAHHALKTVVMGGMSARSFSFAALVVSLSLTVVMLLSASMALVYMTIVKPGRLESNTRYLITNRRVLIQCGDDELHLDRGRIVDVIDAPAEKGLRHLFLVLDGPRARAVAASGAFGESGVGGLQPVLRRIADAEAIQEILRTQGPASRAPAAA